MCRPCRSIHRREYRERNIESFKEKDRVHYEKYREKKLLQSKQYYQKNRDKIQAQRKEYRENNVEYHKEKQREYYNNNLSKRLGIVYRNRVRSEIGSGKGYSDFLGCSIEFLQKWFEFNFDIDNDYYWDNFGKYWEIDHVIPCYHFDMENIDDVRKCFHWTNTKPLSVSKNRSKNRYIWPYLSLEQELRVQIFRRLNN